MSRKPGIVIDESKQWESPSIFRRIWHSVLAVFFGAIFAQVMAFAFIRASILFWYDSYLFIAFLIVCAIFGAVYGDKFISTLRKYISEWSGLWGFWRF